MIVTRYRLAPLLKVDDWEKKASSGEWHVYAGCLRGTIEEDRAADDESWQPASGGYDWKLESDESSLCIKEGWNETLEHAKQNVELALKEFGFKVRRQK